MSCINCGEADGFCAAHCRLAHAAPAVRIAHPHVELVDGRPLVRGSKVPVRRLWSWYVRGVTVDTLVKRYPTLGPARVLDALSFGYDNTDLIEADLARENAEMLGTPLVSSIPVQLPLPRARK